VVAASNYHREIVDSNLTHCAVENGPRQTANAHMPLSPSSIIGYWPNGGDALKLGRKLLAWRKVLSNYCSTAGYNDYCHQRADCQRPGSDPDVTLICKYGTNCQNNYIWHFITLDNFITACTVVQAVV